MSLLAHVKSIFASLLAQSTDREPTEPSPDGNRALRHEQRDVSPAEARSAAGAPPETLRARGFYDDFD